MDDLNAMLVQLAHAGCHPCISFRGDVWRAHINAAGNWWEEEADTPIAALQASVCAWAIAGRPMDSLDAMPRGDELKSLVSQEKARG